MRNNEMIKRISVKCMTAIMGAAAVMSPITAGMCTVIEAQAEGYTYETWTATSGTVSAGQTVGTNSGTITDNYGTVHDNHGTIKNNNSGGTIEGNFGTVEGNNSGGSVTNNSGGTVEVNNGGTVTNNSGGTIGVNSGGIVTNNNGGVVEINNGGDVTNNSGGVLQQNISGTATNNSGGVVQLNNTGGEVTNNDGGTVTNNSGIVFNASDTSVVTNNCSGGIVNGGSVTNNNGIVNEGSVTNNLDGGEVNNGDVTDNWSGGTVNGNSRVTNNHGGTLSGDNIVCQNPNLTSKSGPDPAPVDPTPAPDPTPDPGPSDSSTKNNSSGDSLDWYISSDEYWKNLNELRKRLVPLDYEATGGYQYDNVLSGGPAVAAWNDDVSFKEKIDSGMAALNRESDVTSAGVASGQTLQIDMGNANVFTPVMVNQLAKVTDQGVAVSMTMKENGEQIQLNLVAESDFRAVNFYNEQTGSQAEGPKFLESMIPESSIVYSNGHVNKNTDDIGTNVMKAAGYIGMYQAKQSGVVSAQGAPLEAIVSVSKADAVSSGGTQNIAGGTLTDDNRSSFTEIVSGAITQTIQSGGTATQTTISGGEQLVSSGGIAKQTTLEGGTQTVIGGVTSGGTQTVDSGRDVKVENGGNIQASSEALQAGSGALQVSNGGTATQITESGGTQTVASGGITISAGLISGGTQTVDDGREVKAGNDVKLHAGNGDLKVGSDIQAGHDVALQAGNGGTAKQTTLEGGTQTVDFGGTNQATISDEKLQVANGGTATSAGLIESDSGWLHNGGTQTIHNGGTVNAANTVTITVKTQDGNILICTYVPIPEFSQSLENGEDKAYLVKNGAITQIVSDSIIQAGGN